LPSAAESHPAATAAEDKPAPAGPPHTDVGASLGKPQAGPGTPPTPSPAADAAPDGKVKLAGPGTPPAPPTEVAQGPAPPASLVTPRAVPPVGAPATAASPPITVVPPAGGARPTLSAPVVESFTEETHPCRPGDTWETISRDKYHTPKYARALMQFNQAHPLAGDGLQGPDPVLKAGQAVYIPPISILERRFPAAIDAPTPLPTATALAPAAPTGFVAPAAAAPGVAAPAAAKVYRVGGDGEYLREIARRTLGDSERWREIWELNGRGDPQRAPAGTVLRLPADARVP
jgi:nucleoid-associated protein YgaU